MSKPNVSQQTIDVYEKWSSLTEPFWGLCKNVLDELFKKPLFLVVLKYPVKEHVLTPSQVRTMISGKKVAQDGDYKITLADIPEGTSVMDDVREVTFDLCLRLGLNLRHSDAETVINSCTVTESWITRVDNISNLWMEHKISTSENHYGFFRFGGKTSLGRSMPLGATISINFDGQLYTSKHPISTHRTIRGRVDGLTQLYRMFPEKLAAGNVVAVSFDAQTTTLHIRSLQNVLPDMDDFVIQS